jgi:predicted TIM-barrel fold metal-dependent hydrolase
MTAAQSRNRRIDVHHHVVPPEFVDDAMPIRPPAAEEQLAAMDRWGIRAAITSLTPRVLLKNRHRLRAVARSCNEFQARRVSDQPERLGAFALLPLPDVDGALEEIAYALDILRLDGIGLFSSVNDHYLGDARFDPVFDELNRRGAALFLHPTHCEAPENSGLRAPPFVVEYVFDTTRAIVNLLYSGTLRRCPNLRLIVAHGGGAAPFLAQRIAMMEGHRGAKSVTGVMPALRSLFYEIASTTSAPALRCLQELADPERILWGSDLPFVYGERLRDEVEHWEHYDGFDPAARSAIEETNALRLFPRFARAGSPLGSVGQQPLRGAQ